MIDTCKMQLEHISAQNIYVWVDQNNKTIQTFSTEVPSNYLLSLKRRMNLGLDPITLSKIAIAPSTRRPTALPKAKITTMTMQGKLGQIFQQIR